MQQQQIRECLKTNPTTIQFVIQYEVLDKKSPFDSYKSFCKRVGDDVMDFNEFEFWYMRFYHGKLDLDYDRNSEPKALKFSDLPNEMISEAVEKLDPVSRVVVRHVSKGLRFVVDKLKTNIKNIKIDTTKSDRVSISLDNKTISYQKTESGCLIEYENQQISVENGEYLKLVLNDLKATMETQKLKVDNLYLKSEANETLESILKDVCFSLCSQIHVKSLTIDTLEPQTMSSLICFLKPRVLENIRIRAPERSSVSSLFETEQWKQAKNLDLLALKDFNVRETCHFSHFNSFQVKSEQFFSCNTLGYLKNSLLTSSTFQKCKIYGFLNYGDPDPVGDVFRTLFRGLNRLRFQFAGSTDILEFKCHWDTVVFERMQL